MKFVPQTDGMGNESLCLCNASKALNFLEYISIMEN
jgi:hypothetical protein